jgi:hypothetical protein
MIIFVNGLEVEQSKDSNFARVQQVNEIGNISSTLSNYSNIRLPKTAKNNRIFSNLNAVGNTSNFAYQINTADVINENTGEHIVRGGFCTMVEVSENYIISIYDGFIDFAKQIENKTLFQIGLPNLNHVKNNINIANTWNNNLDYCYLLADFNGKIPPNLDYQSPSAKAAYLWNRIFEFAGFTYEGSIFDTEAFQELFLTYPKPVSQSDPETTLVGTRSSATVQIVTQIPTANGIEYVFSDVFQLQSGSPIVAPETAQYRISVSGFTDIEYRVIIGNLVEPTYNEIHDFSENNFIIIGANEGDTFTIQKANFTDTDGNITLTVELITGYNVGFDTAFIDFQCTEFLKEIMNRFGLIPFTDSANKNIVFKTLREIVQDDVQDYSKFFIEEKKTSFVFSKYSQENEYKFQYPFDFQKHNDGVIKLNNKNINAKRTLWQSRTFSPDNQNTQFANTQLLRLPIYEREINNENEVEYKELNGRFFFVKREFVAGTFIFSSSIFSSVTVGGFFKANFFRCSWTDLLFDYYNEYRLILNNANIKSVDFYLSELNYNRLRLDRLIRVDQLGASFLINKIGAFNKLRTNLELVQVNEFTEPTDFNEPPINFINIISINQEDCEVTLSVNTNLTNGSDVIVNVYIEGILSPDLQISSTYNDGVISFSATDLPNGTYQFSIYSQENGFFYNFISGLSDEITLNCFSGAEPTSLTIDSAIFGTPYRNILGTGANINVAVEIDTDAVLPAEIEIFFSTNFENPFVSFGTQIIGSENFNVTYGYFLNVFGTLVPPPHGVRMQIRIGSLFSNIYTIT